MKDEHKIVHKECFVGNIIGPHYWGEQKIIRYGTKHFRPGAKVYCIFMYGGMGHEQIRVMGKPRRQRRMIDIVIAACYIKNVRLSKTYDKRVIAFLKRYSNGCKDWEWAKPMAESINANHCEIPNENLTMRE